MKAYKWLLNEIGQDAITDNPLNIAKLLEKYHNEIDAKPQQSNRVLFAGDQGDYIKKLNAAIQAQPSTLTDDEIRGLAIKHAKGNDLVCGSIILALNEVRDKAQGVDLEEVDKIVLSIQEEHPYKQAGNPDSYSQYAEGWSDACDILGHQIKDYLEQRNQQPKR